MFEQIMIPLDGSTVAEAALPIAKQIAQATSGTIHLVSVPEDELTVSQRVVGYTWIGAAQRRADVAAKRQAYLEAVREAWFSAENIR